MRRSAVLSLPPQLVFPVPSLASERKLFLKHLNKKCFRTIPNVYLCLLEKLGLYNKVRGKGIKIKEK
jgi:hypothetical protein